MLIRFTTQDIGHLEILPINKKDTDLDLKNKLHMMIYLLYKSHKSSQVNCVR